MPSIDLIDDLIDCTTTMHLSESVTGTECIFDWQQLRQLSEGNVEFELELLHIFVAETASLLRQAQQAVFQKDDRLLAHIAHQLKGSSWTIGMQGLAQMAKELELFVHAQEWEKATKQLEPMSQLLNYVQSLLLET